MKVIKGHNSRDLGEVVDILVKSGTFTCPTLPHFRYQTTRRACRRLQRAGLVAVSGQTSEAKNLTVTPLFRQWQSAKANGETVLGVMRWVKEAEGEATP